MALGSLLLTRDECRTPNAGPASESEPVLPVAAFESGVRFGTRLAIEVHAFCH